MSSEQDNLTKQLADAHWIITQQASEIEQIKQSIHQLNQKAEANSQEYSQRVAERNALGEVAAAISSAMEVMCAEASSLMMVDEQGEELVFEVATGVKGESLKGIRLPVGQGIAGWVARTREPAMVPDAYQDPRFNPESDQITGFRTKSLLCVPLMMHDRFLGVAQVLNCKNKESFDETDLETFTSFARHATIAIETAHLYEARQLANRQWIIEQQAGEIEQLTRSSEELERKAMGASDELNQRLEESNALNQVAAAISSVMAVEPLLEMIMEKSKEVMSAEASSLMMLDEESQELVFQVATGEKGSAIREIRLPVGRGIAGWVAQSKEPLLVPDAYQDPRFNPEADRRSGFRTRSIMCVPLTMQDRILGVVQVLNSKEKESFDERDLETFTSFADHAAIAVENARLYEETKQRAEELRQALERERWLTLQRDKLGKYVPKSVVDEIERDREQALAFETRMIECSILFSDIKGFTRFTEAHPAEKMVEMLNNYHSAMNTVVDKYDGVLDKFMGDGIMVVFLSQGEEDNHALRAMRCGIEMQEEVGRLDEEWMAEGLGNLSIRIGVNTGEVISGSIGAETRMDYTVVGDNVNVASRLESNGEPGTVLFSDSVYQLVEDSIPAEKLEPIYVKNRVQPVQAYSIDVLHLETS